MDISTVDWCSHIVFMIFASGCVFSCPYCQNANLIPLNSGQEVDIDFLKQRIEGNVGLIDAVGFSGGEPTLQPEAVTELFAWAKKMGLKTFLNTNGANPDIIRNLVNSKLVDYVALSVVAPLNPKDYGRVMGKPDSSDKAVENVKKSIEICLNSKIPLEVRTTIVPTLIEDEQSIREIAKSVKGCSVYILQQYSSLGNILDPKFKSVEPPKKELLTRLAKAVLEENAMEVHIRTRENGEEAVKLHS